MDEDLRPIIEAMEDFSEDNSVPKNVKTKIETIIGELKSDSDKSIKINKALQELEEISDDSNLQSFNRTQIWNIISLLESV
jgi:uncharacterized protein (UPF0147 family)